MRVNISEEWIRDVSSFGSMAFCCFLCAAALAFGNLQAFARLAAGFVSIIILAYAIRLFHFKERPNKRRAEGGILSRLDASSFPSVHAARISFISAAFLSVSPTLFLLGSILVVAVDFSRIKTKNHFIEDVIFGNAAGYAIGYIIFFAI